MYSNETEQMSYEQIKQLAKATGRRVNDLIVLAPQNDPFYTGTPSDWTLGQWFAELWNQFGYQTKVHIRRVHYQIISQTPPVVMPNGKPYENTMDCWEMLNMASKAARYLQLVDPANFNDRRSPDVIAYARHQPSQPDVQVYGRLYGSNVNFPEFPDLPSYSVRGYGAEQAYHLEVWCEKSTMNDVLVPLCERYGANLQTGLGELSITATLALVRRIQDAGKPARIFYVSDFDPAGQSMPVAVSRKIEYFVRTLGLELDIRVFPVILTQEQVQYYRLPRTPIKETERRRFGFEERYGEGAVELDALEALYPGQLHDLLAQYMNCYYDTSLDARTEEMRRILEHDLSQVWQTVLVRYQPALAALQAEHDQVQAEFAERMTGYSERLQDVWHAIRTDLAHAAPSVASYPVPEPEIGAELGDGLYNSARDYMEQIDAYKLFQGKS